MLYVCVYFLKLIIIYIVNNNNKLIHTQIYDQLSSNVFGVLEQF